MHLKKSPRRTSAAGRPARTQASTRQRVLDAACEVFSEHSYRDATVAAICRRAKVNIASVNYHFGDKEKLYDAVWRHAWQMAEATVPIEKAGAPRDRLRAHIRALLYRGLSPGPASWFSRIMVKEMAEPTPALARIEQEVLQIQRDRLRSAIRELVGLSVTPEDVNRCCFSIISQCLFLNCNRAVREQQLKIEGLGRECIAPMAEHIACFSLAGLSAIKSRAARGAAGGPSPKPRPARRRTPA